MKNDDFLNFFQKLSNPKPDKSLLDYMQVVWRRKWILAATVILAVICAVIYNKYVQPKYIATVTLKKDSDFNSKQKDQFSIITMMQNGDKLNTDMKIVKTNEVLKKVVDEQKLFLSITKIERPNSNLQMVNELFLNYRQKYLTDNHDSTEYPQFVGTKIFQNNSGGHYYLVKDSNNVLSLYNGFTNRLIQKSEPKDTAAFLFNSSQISVVWKDAPIGSKVYFSIEKYSSVLANLESRITLDNEEGTNLFKISVVGDSPYEAQQTANTLSEKFKETRIEQLKRSIRYSFNFVDQQLNEVTEKLKKVEDDIKKFKSANKMVVMNESSTQIVELLGKLEVEKVNVDLELTEYNNKLSEIEGEYQSKKFFDQTYLTPNKATDAYSPFSSLLLKLSDLEIQRIEALNRKRENHPDIQKLDDQIREIKSSLENYNQNTITAYQIIVNSLKEKQNKLNNLITNYGYELARLPANETQLAKMLREKNVYEKVFTMLLDKREELRMAELSKLQDIQILEPAQKPLYASIPRVNFNIMVGCFIGLLLGCMVIAFVQIKNRKNLQMDDVENEYDIPIYAIIPNYNREIMKRIEKSKKYEDRFVTLMEQENGYKETYRLLMSKIALLCDKNSKVLMFSSCEEHTGKTSVVANLGMSLVQSNKNVLLIDCDFKRSQLTNMFGLSKNSSGLVNAIAEKKSTPVIYDIYKSKMNGSFSKLHLVTTGGIKENSISMLETPEFKKMIEILSHNEYDYILIDTPPITRVVDAMILAKIIKDTILIVRPNYTLSDSFKWGIKELKQAGAVIHSIVVNACDIQHSSFKNSYGYGYCYKYSSNDEKYVNEWSKTN